jgi:hypothetical protein
MNLNINIYAIIVLVVSAVLGFGGSVIANMISNDESKVIKLKIVFKAIAMLGIIAALLITIYL